jgi:hypothetical protein
MLDKNDFTYEDDITFQNLEFSPVSDESFERQREPFGPGENYPPDFNSPGGFDYDNFPNFNFPGGNFTPPGMPTSPPPNYIPQKDGAGVQKMAFGEGPGIGTKAVSGSSIRFCLYKYTYIWEDSGRSYWAFLLNVSRRTVSGFRWFRRHWVYFGIDLRRIDSFVCYRSNSEENCKVCDNLTRSNTSLLLSNKKEYSLNGTRDVYTQTLASIDIPEIKEDFITKNIGNVDDTKITSEMPCVKARNICYRINLEVTYPSDYDEDLKSKINELAKEVSHDVFKVASSDRGNDMESDPLEAFNSSLKLIPEALRIFSNSFNDKLNLLNSTIDNPKDITCSIRNEKIYNDWKPYFYNDSLY